jgi:hypothetical protein
MARPRKAAVISADVIGSSMINTAARKKLQAVLDSFNLQASKQWPDFNMQQYRGDSLQAILTTNRATSLRVGLMLQSAIMKNKFGLRIAIGIGEISFQGKNIITSDGSAFWASGPYLDMLRKSGEVIDVNLNNPDLTDEWWIHSASLNYIIQRWSAPQAEAIYFQLQDYTQQEMARKLKIKQPSVHQRLQGAGWPVVQKILARFEAVVTTL